MAKNVTGDNENQQVLIPMIVDRKSFEEGGCILGVERSQIRKWKIGDRVLDVVPVRGTVEQYRSIMDEYYREYKAEARNQRCAVPGQDGKLIRCPDERKCEGCPYDLKRELYAPANFSDLATEDEDGETVEFDPVAPENYDSADRYLRILEDLVRHVSEIDPEYGILIRMLHDGESRREVAEEMKIPKSTMIDRISKLKKIAEEFVANLNY